MVEIPSIVKVKLMLKKTPMIIRIINCFTNKAMFLMTKSYVFGGK